MRIAPLVEMKRSLVAHDEVEVQFHKRFQIGDDILSHRKQIEAIIRNLLVAKDVRGFVFPFEPLGVGEIQHD